MSCHQSWLAVEVAPLVAAQVGVHCPSSIPAPPNVTPTRFANIWARPRSGKAVSARSSCWISVEVVSANGSGGGGITMVGVCVVAVKWCGFGWVGLTLLHTHTHTHIHTGGCGVVGRLDSFLP